jgi:hypothetical protein
MRPAAITFDPASTLKRLSQYYGLKWQVPRLNIIVKNQDEGIGLL